MKKIDLPKPAPLKLIVSISLFILSSFYASAQYYAKGIITDENGTPLYNIKLQLSTRKPAVFFSGSTGEFGIPSAIAEDTIFIEADGYENYKKLINTNIYQVISLKSLPGSRSVIKNKLASFVINNTGNTNLLQNNTGESYSKLVENYFVKTNEYPESGFTLNIDRASYSNIRRFINMGMVVPPDAVRIDEILNYFDFTSDASSTNSFSLNYIQSKSPWDKNSQLLFLLLQSPKIDVSDLPPANLVFLIDVSGSMDQPNRLPLLQQS
ncbi:MAG: von Willebrand factor type A domain-containing protein, partial [Bacteroidota bacterium]